MKIYMSSSVALALLSPAANAFSPSCLSTTAARPFTGTTSIGMMKNNWNMISQQSTRTAFGASPLFATDDGAEEPTEEDATDAVTAKVDDEDEESDATEEAVKEDEAAAEAVETETEPESEPEPEPEPEASTETGMTSTEKNKLLQKMLMLASSTDRGQFASPSQKQSMQDMISQLESHASSTTISSDEEVYANPTETTAINGTWELLYSSTQLFGSSPFFMAGRSVCKTQEEADRYDWFCDMHRAALAISEIGKVRQIIGNGRMVSEFEVRAGAVPFIGDFTPFQYAGGLPFAITGAIVSSADIEATNGGTAWEIFMDQVEIKGSNVPLLRSILDKENVALQSRKLGSFLEENVESYSNPKPIFTTTYLDNDIRISRDEDGKVFVYGKMSDDTEPTDYKGVDADLGLLGLLEGLNDNFFKFSV